MSLLRVVFSKVSPVHWRRLARVARSFAPNFWCSSEECCKHAIFQGFCVLKLIKRYESHDEWHIQETLMDGQSEMYNSGESKCIYTFPRAVYRAHITYFLESKPFSYMGFIQKNLMGNTLKEIIRVTCL